MPAPSADVAQPTERTLVDEVHDGVVGLIVHEHLPPGGRLSMDALAKRLGVSPTPLREALPRLEHDGLVVKEPRRGYRVTPVLSRDDVTALFELRELVEPWATARAAQRVRTGRAVDDVAELRREVARAGAVGDHAHPDEVALAQHDRRLHLRLLRMADNETVREAVARTRWHLHLLRVAVSTRSRIDPIAEHARIVAAVVDGDERAAADAMRDHLQDARDKTVAAIERVAPARRRDPQPTLRDQADALRERLVPLARPV